MTFFRVCIPVGYIPPCFFSPASWALARVIRGSQSPNRHNELSPPPQNTPPANPHRPSLLTGHRACGQGGDRGHAPHGPHGRAHGHGARRGSARRRTCARHARGSGRHTCVTRCRGSRYRTCAPRCRGSGRRTCGRADHAPGHGDGDGAHGGRGRDRGGGGGQCPRPAHAAGRQQGGHPAQIHTSPHFEPSEKVQ